MTHVNGTPDVPSAAAVWSVHGRYSTMSECRDIAIQGDVFGRWSDWECVDNLPIDVQLRVVCS
ncbi:hypothetical protein [Streptomyces sp. MP131-18]|uniref:hypothetical protein n=1 Tax=Streptomyces sp. MP131-18 TaxID=1857892 RepID=UPI00097CB7C2|nr:hypothetical protein [Streptomyces sp. MP131-18]